jgi:hypothetical protein
MTARRILVVALCAAWPTAFACGSRTELFVPEQLDAALDAPNDHSEGSSNALDAPEDHRDAAPDVLDASEEDALPPIDAFPDVPILTDCPDAGATLVYVITSQNELYSFYPPTLAFTKIGTVACPSASSPFSMAVDRVGFAYSVFTDGTLFQVNTANAACKPTTYVPDQQGFLTFGMGYSGEPDGGDTLYVAEANFMGNSKGLGSIDTNSFVLSFVGPFNPPLGACELTGTHDGRLFAYCTPMSGNGSTIAEIDRTTGNVIASNSLNVGNSNDAFAFAFWGGQFWIFTGPGGGSSTVTQYDPVSKSETTVAMLASTIVGAGVSTCAPQ